MNNPKRTKRIGIIKVLFVTILVIIGIFFCFKSLLFPPQEMTRYKEVHLLSDNYSRYDASDDYLIKNYWQYGDFLKKYENSQYSSYNADSRLSWQNFISNDYIVHFYSTHDCSEQQYFVSIKISSEDILLTESHKNVHRPANTIGGVCGLSNSAYLIPIEKGKLDSILPVSVNHIDSW